MTQATNFPPGPDLVLGERFKDACCPVCGDASLFRLWIDSRRPLYCPEDPAATTGGPRTIATVDQCPINSPEAKARSKANREWLTALIAKRKQEHGQ